uniref:Uncharacterized protein n=1 Tax=Opuntia streptacantha TaxID=393608 RepID=A0A7C8ZN25_OPUST
MDIGKHQRKPLGIQVLLFPLPFQGHMNPMLHLGNALYSKGFSITIIQTRFNSPDTTEFPNFAFHFIDDGLQMSSAALFDALSAVKASCLEKFRHCLSQILNGDCENKEPIACLITDPSWEFAGTVADSFNLPRIALKTGSILSYIVYEALPLLREKGYFPIPGSKALTLICICLYMEGSRYNCIILNQMDEYVTVR